MEPNQPVGTYYQRHKEQILQKQKEKRLNLEYREKCRLRCLAIARKHATSRKLARQVWFLNRALVKPSKTEQYYNKIKYFIMKKSPFFGLTLDIETL